ncbi:MAG: hypothetical protein ABIJ34_04060 [archaeon]
MEKIVSVRMPVSLLDELKVLAEKDHYMDVSDAIRSVLRSRWMDSKSPKSAKINEIKKALGDFAEPDKIDALKKTLKLLEELNEI